MEMVSSSKPSSDVFDLNIRLAELSDAMEKASQVDSKLSAVWSDVRPQLELLTGPAESIRKSLPSAVCHIYSRLQFYLSLI